jgi:prepilin-type N-terminal cleavage/methylation domain-containing protein
MRLHRAPARRRGGFTLIEMLVVIGIIVTLIALLTSGVIVSLRKLDEVKVRHEISALTGGITQFQQDFKVEKYPPPSLLYLDESGLYNPSANYPGWAGLSAAQQATLIQLATDSKAYLLSVWPRLAVATDWNLNGTVDAPTVLEGEQCLVFFLAGPIVNGTPIGFSTDTSFPMKTTGPRKGPYFKFETGRLDFLTPKNGYPVYCDAYSTSVPLGQPHLPTDRPYAYFSSGSKTNGYNAYPGYGSDCLSLGITQGAYCQTSAAPLQFHKENGFQIISAGRDRKFGPGGYWESKLGASGMGTLGAGDGADDITNFYDAKLGVIP